MDTTLPPDIEDPETYREGGYHLVLIGDRYKDGRYEIVHKLGHTDRATIWLAQDHKAAKFVEWVFAVGVPPKAWWQKWEKRSEYFWNDGTPKVASRHHCTMQCLISLKEKLRLMERGSFPIAWPC